MNKFFTSLIGMTSIILFQAQIAQSQEINSGQKPIQPVIISQNTQDLETIAAQITVRIKGQTDPGSGVIIARKGTSYYVLTARHVISGTHIGEDIYITTKDNKEHQITIDETNVINLPDNVDLSLIKFTSDNNYSVATISQFNYRLYYKKDYTNNVLSSAPSEQYVFVSGWPLIDNNQSQFVFNPGILFDNSGTAISSNQANPPGDKQFGGYNLIYTNLTHPGMSGGPVLDTQGRLIGIHGLADGRVIGEEDEIIQDYIEEVGFPINIKIGFSQGIPIQIFLKWAETDPVIAYLKIEDNPPPSLTPELINSWQPPITITDTENPYYWLEKGNQLWRIGRVAEARGAYEQAIKYREDLYLAWFAKGFALILQGNDQLALEACDQATQLQVKPSVYLYEAYRCKAEALKVLGRLESALLSLEEAMAINQDNPNPADFVTQGELRYALENYRGALESFNHAIELRTSQNLYPSPLIYNNRALVKMELGQYDVARKDIETALQIDPDYTPAWRNKGLLLKAMEQPEEALEAYDHALTLDNQDYMIWTNRAVVLYEMGEYQQAKASLEQAIKIKPDYTPAINSLNELNLQLQENPSP